MAKVKKQSIAEFAGVKYYLSDDGQLVDKEGNPAPKAVAKALVKEGELTPKNNAAEIGASISPAFSRSLGMNIAPPMTADQIVSAAPATSAADNKLLAKIESNTKQTNALLQTMINQMARQYEEQNEILRRGLLSDQLDEQGDDQDGMRRGRWWNRLFGQNNNRSITPTPDGEPQGGGGIDFPFGFGRRKGGGGKTSPAGKGSRLGRFGRMVGRGALLAGKFAALAALGGAGIWAFSYLTSDESTQERMLDEIENLANSVKEIIGSPQFVAAAAGTAFVSTAAALSGMLAKIRGGGPVKTPTPVEPTVKPSGPIGDPETKPPPPAKTSGVPKVAAEAAATNSGWANRGSGIAAERSVPVEGNAAGTAAKAATKEAIKKSVAKRVTAGVASKLLPGLGLAAAGYFAYQDLKNGNLTGAALTAGSGIMATFGGPKGFIGAMGMEVYRIAREVYNDVHGVYPESAAAEGMSEIMEEVWNTSKDVAGSSVNSVVETLKKVGPQNPADRGVVMQSYDENSMLFGQQPEEAPAPTGSPKIIPGAEAEYHDFNAKIIPGEEAEYVEPLTRGQKLFLEKIERNKSLTPAQKVRDSAIAGADKPVNNAPVIIKQGDTINHYGTQKGAGGMVLPGAPALSAPIKPWDYFLYGRTRFD